MGRELENDVWLEILHGLETFIVAVGNIFYHDYRIAQREFQTDRSEINSGTNRTL